MSSAALDAAEAATSREPTETELDEANHELDDAKHHHGINVSAGMEHWGKPGHLTETEKAKLQEFQKAEPKVNNVQALRFLRARRFDVAKALALLKESRAFAEKERPWELQIPQDVARNLLEMAFMPCLHLDPAGRPVLLADPSKHTTKMGPATIKLFYFLMERMIASMPPTQTEIIVMFDLSKYSYANSDLRSAAQVVHTLQVGYPERLCRCVIYMAPKIFFVLWKAVRRFMDERLTSKIQFAYDLKELHAGIDKGVLPPVYGGTGPAHDQAALFQHFIVDKKPFLPYPGATNHHAPAGKS